MRKIWINRKYILRKGSQISAYIFSIIGFIGIFAPLSDVFPKEMNVIIKILISGGVCACVWVITCGIIARWFNKEKMLEVFEISNDCHVYVQYGDIFSSDVIKTENKKRNIVIPVNRCFDTIVDNDLISEKTLHGIAFSKLYEAGIYDENSLNDAIQDKLAQQHIIPQDILSEDKRAGNLKRYPVGSIAEISISDECTYFLLGLSTFNYNLKAETSMEDYVLAMQKLIQYCCDRSQQFPVAIPLIGAGLSRANKRERFILEFIVKLLKMNQELIKSDIYIIVRDSGKDTIEITDL